ncbi:MAG: hypothetical protein GPJ12_12670 [Microcystis aeruginosa S11-01]|nr:hypothetical protein [Microcystis aeruginosa S11-01]
MSINQLNALFRVCGKKFVGGVRVWGVGCGVWGVGCGGVLPILRGSIT